MHFFKNESNSDVILIIDGNRVPAHKFLLGLKSPVFYKMFFRHFEESNAKEIEIKEASIRSFEVMLKWIYCQKFDLNDKNDYLLAIDVFKLCHRFELQRLMETIERKLIEMITICNNDVIYKLATF
jgi:hypothetical protein